MDFNKEKIKIIDNESIDKTINLLNTNMNIENKRSMNDTDNDMILEKLLQSENNAQQFISKIHCILESNTTIDSENSESLDYPHCLKTIEENVEFKFNTSDQKHLNSIKEVNYVTCDIIDMPEEYNTFLTDRNTY